MVPSLRLADPLIGLSAIGDLGRGREPGQSARSCFIACRLARSLGGADSIVQDVFYAALLQHIGCVAHAHDTAPLDRGRTIAVNAAVDLTDFSRPREIFGMFLPELSGSTDVLGRLQFVLPARRMARVALSTSCDIAEAVARRLGLPDGVLTTVRHMNEWYNGKGGFLGRKGEEIPLAARVVFAAFTISIFDVVAGPGAAMAVTKGRAGRSIDPDVAGAFVRHGAEILKELDGLDVLRALPAEEPDPKRTVRDAQLDEIAVAFGEAVDLKAPFTHGSARRASDLAGRAATALALDADQVTQTRRAAALRDIGKSAVPNAVVEKAGALAQSEWEQMRLHAYHTERVLSRSPALAAEARLAGLHHEREDGSGYHRGCAGTSIPMAARLIAATDALVAMTQPRPQRGAMSLDRACAELEEGVRRHHLHPDAARAVVQAARGITGRVRRPLPAGLTERQAEVLRLVAEGLSNRQIAERLFVTTRTAEHHVQDVYMKIGVASRAGAAMFAVEHQLLQ